ncbi:zinc finger protein 814-like [Physella acuta]|uniref:zinc finger protein 814-like n=1 Tax=Physella acuta TaxID=109671 RepID=UPI0027DC6875|nr:zinc finger protein 814-like [Physella acuta]
MASPNKLRKMSGEQNSKGSQGEANFSYSSPTKGLCYTTSDDESISEDSSSCDDFPAEYKCKLCNLVLHRISQLKKHMRTQHVREMHSSEQMPSHLKALRCKACFRKFQNPIALQAHLLKKRFCFWSLTQTFWSRKSDETQACKICGKNLFTTRALRRHCYKDLTCKLHYIQQAMGSTVSFEKVNDQSHTKIKRSNSTFIEMQENNEDSVCMDGLASSTPIITGKAPGSSTQSQGSMVLLASKEVSSITSNSVENISHNISSDELTVNSSRLNECGYCKQSFDNKSALKRHILTHTVCLHFYEDPKSECPVVLNFCFKCKFRAQNSLQFKHHHCKGNVPYTEVCEHCDAKFTSWKSLKLHQNTSNVCSAKKSEKQQSLNRTTPVPKRKLDSDKKFTCLLCSQIFLNFNLFLEHSKSHEEEGKYICFLCDQLFNHYSSLVLHHVSHTEQQEPATNSSQHEQDTNNSLEGLGSRRKRIAKKFAEPDNSYKKYYKCKTCGQKFDSLVKRRKHLSASVRCKMIKPKGIEDEHQDDSDPSTALLAPGSAPLTNGKDLHSTNDAGKCQEVFCFRCKNVLSSSNALKYHKCKNSRLLNLELYSKASWTDYECKICDKTYQGHNQLVVHMVKHGEDMGLYQPSIKSIPTVLSSSCILCDKKLSRRHAEQHFQEHLDVITEEILDGASSLNCGICGQKYSTGQILKDHIMQHKPSDIISKNGKVDKRNVLSKFPCPCCRLTFLSYPSLKAHAKLKHRTVYKTKPYIFSYNPKQLEVALDAAKVQDGHGAQTSPKRGRPRGIRKQLIPKRKEKNGMIKLSKHGLVETVDTYYPQAEHTDELDNETDLSLLLPWREVKVSCHLCPATIAASSHESHLKTQHNFPVSKLFGCKYCRLKFPWQNECNKHTDRCQALCECKICMKQLNSLTGIKRHIIIAHSMSIKDYENNFLSAFIDAGMSKKEHLSMDENDFQKHCPVCQEVFSRNSLYLAHLESHMSSANLLSPHSRSLIQHYNDNINYRLDGTSLNASLDGGASFNPVIKKISSCDECDELSYSDINMEDNLAVTFKESDKK